MAKKSEENKAPEVVIAAITKSVNEEININPALIDPMSKNAEEKIKEQINEALSENPLLSLNVESGEVTQVGTIPKAEYEKIVKELELKTEDFKCVENLNNELAQKLLLANNSIKLINETNSELKNIAISQKLQIDEAVKTAKNPYIFWAYKNNRTSFASYPTLEELNEHLKGEFINHSESFIAKKFIDETKLTDEEFLNLLIHNTIGRIEEKNV